jgi:hypothetical protein
MNLLEKFNFSFFKGVKFYLLKWKVFLMVLQSKFDICSVLFFLSFHWRRFASAWMLILYNFLMFSMRNQAYTEQFCITYISVLRCVKKSSSLAYLLNCNWQSNYDKVSSTFKCNSNLIKCFSIYDYTTLHVFFRKVSSIIFDRFFCCWLWLCTWIFPSTSGFWANWTFIGQKWPVLQ